MVYHQVASDLGKSFVKVQVIVFDKDGWGIQGALVGAGASTVMYGASPCGAQADEFQSRLAFCPGGAGDRARTFE